MRIPLATEGFRDRAGVAAAALLAFGLAVGGTFHLDDYALLEGLRPPVRWLTWWSYQLNGPHPAALLAVQVLLHAANAVLVRGLLGRFLPAPEAQFAALMFAVHPVQAEAVNYIFARATLLSASFALLTLRDWCAGSRYRALAWTLAALAAKEDALALPLVLLLIDRRWSAPLALQFLMAAAAGGWSLYAAITTAGSGAATGSGRLWADYLVAQGVAIWRYLRLTLFPWGLTLDPELRVEWGVVGWAALAAALGCLRHRRETWMAFAGILYLLPSSSIVPLADLAADRRMYLPLAAFAGVVARFPWTRATRAMLLAALALLSLRQCLVWRTEESLWRYVVARSPNTLRPKLQLARAVTPEECLALLSTAQIRWPEDDRIPAEMGRCALQAGDAAAALRYFGKALALRPGYSPYEANRDAAVRLLTGAPPRQ